MTMGIDSVHRHAQALENAGSDALAKEDYQKAAKWFTTAAAQPDFKAQSGLEKQVRDRWAEANERLRASR